MHIECLSVEQGLVTGVYIKKRNIVSNGTNIEFEFEYYMVDGQNNSHILASEDSECDLGN